MRRFLYLFVAALLILTVAACQEHSKITTGENGQETAVVASPEEISEEEHIEEEQPVETEPYIEEEPAIPLAPYKGVVEHIFIHPLIPYPEVTFKSREAMGFDDWFITVTEFTRILPELYRRNFILVDINQIYETVDTNGRSIVQRKELLLPPGKKPLILSIDDLNYYKYMIDSGLVHRLVLDEAGDVAAYLVTPEGQTLISKEIEVISILDEFVKQHPDFSHNGAKGIIALTGYEGILGYRTHKWNPNNQSEREKVAPVVARLKESGWTFASHSYAHHSLAKMPYSDLVSDTRQWKEEVEILVGSTQVYIYPFGSSVPEGSDKFKHLLSQGFTIFCAVGPRSYEKISNNSPAVMTDRRHVDGMTLRNQRDRFLDLYDADEIIDLKARPVR